MNVRFIEITKAKFNQLTTKDDGALYVVKDGNKRELYKGSFFIASGNANSIIVPTKTSQLTNDSGFITSKGLTVIRSRDKTSSLTAVNSTAGVLCNSDLHQGDRLLLEVADYSGASFNQKIIGITVGRSHSTNDSTTDDDAITSFTTYNGTNRVTYSFSFSYSGSYLYFNDFKRITEYFSGNTISVTTDTYTLYVGQIWRLND